MSDLSHLIDTTLLQTFGKETIVPMNGTIAALAAALNGLNDEVEGNAEMLAINEKSPALAAHAAGTYIIYAGEFYKVTRDIAIGDVLTEGTNISKTTIAEELSKGGGGGGDTGLSIVDGKLCVTYDDGE